MSNVGAYCTQIGPDGNGHDRCWAACIASGLLTFGWDSDPFELTRQVAQLPPGEGNPANLDQMQAAAETFGVKVSRWTVWESAATAMAGNDVVVALVDNKYLIPHSYPRGRGWDALHYIRLVEYIDNEQMIYCYDPLTYLTQGGFGLYQGPTIYTKESITNAIMHTPYNDAGLIISHP